jgi:hypothetical protein
MESTETSESVTAKSLAALIAGQQPLTETLLRAIAATTEETMKAILLELQEMPRPEAIGISDQHILFSLPSGVPTDYASTKTFWWGWILYLPAKVMKEIKAVGPTADAIGKILIASATAGAIAAAAQPYIALAAASIAARLALMILADKGNGIMLISPWVQPVVLVPYPI